MKLIVNRHFLKLIFLNVVIFSLVSCITQSGNTMASHIASHERVFYDFEFDLSSTPDIELIDYTLETENPDHTFKARLFGTATGPVVLQSYNIGAALHHKPTRLFVKWRIKSTGQEYQETADLRGRLPANMKNSVLTFTMEGKPLGTRLYVYLVLHDELRPKGGAIYGPTLYQAYKVLVLYPN